MKNKIIIPGRIVTADPGYRILSNHAVELSGGIIKRIMPIDKNPLPQGEVYRFENLVMIPGFIQTHIHLCQTLFRGLADDLQLLDWLQYRIFPYENAHDKESLKASVRLGISELLKSGTTTIMDMGTLRHQEIIFDELISSGIRAFAGKCMMDRNELLPSFRSSTEDEIQYTSELASEYHCKNERVKYAFAPRFVLSCSENLLREAHELMSSFPGSLYHTHSSENLDECAKVKDLFGCDNIELFENLNILEERTVLAHCIHISVNEMMMLERTKTKIAHCPSSNLKLGSGIAPVPEFRKRGITVSLGADGAACSNTLNMFNEMRLASLIQKPVHGASVMNAKDIFMMATIEGAKTLNIEHNCGSIEEGKCADFAFLDLGINGAGLSGNDEHLYSEIVYSSGQGNVKHVMTDGEWLVKDAEILRYDDTDLMCDGRVQLNKLLGRI